MSRSAVERRTGARISARGWGHRYPGRADPALRDVTLEIEPGELVVLMGASGSGKSTLLAGLAGTLPAGGSFGELVVCGSDHADAPGPQSPVRLGLVQQEPEGNIVMELVGDDVAFPLENAAVPADAIWTRVGAALAEVGLNVSLGRRTAHLSGGQTQLLAVAAASVAAPHLLLLDEPTANLDPAAAADVRRAVDGVRAATGCTVVVVEHRVEQWLRDADRVVVVEDGTAVALRPGELPAFLAARPGAGARMWLDHGRLPVRSPQLPPGVEALRAHAVAVTERLAATDLVARAGEVVALVGPPGSGKSTLLACLAGLLRPTVGRVDVAIDGGARSEPWTWPSREVAATFGVVFQNPEHQFVTGSVTDELRHGLLGAGVSDQVATARAEAMLQRLHLSELAAVDPFTLSGGQQRRLSVGTALVLDPRILLLDEPTFGQDPTTWAEIVDIIAAHRDAGGSVVVATHDPALVTSLGAREVRLTPVTDDPTPAPLDAGASAVGRATRLGRLDPLALLGSAMLVSAAALVSASVALNLGLVALALLAALLGGLPGRRLGLLAIPAIVASTSVALSNALLSPAGLLSAAAWQAAALPASRVLAVALPGLVAAVAVDPTALADSLVARLRVPARAAYATLAALRLLPLLADEWATLGRASRARGIGGSGVGARAHQFVSMTFRLLVAALRRGGRLAVALDARGLRSDAPRTIARPLHWRWPDTAAVVVAAAVHGAAVVTRGGIIGA